jgi:hypothetical protein
MKEDLDSAARYRQRAEDLRALAAETRDTKARNALLDVADDYERMAQSRERIDRLETKRKT